MFMTKKKEEKIRNRIFNLTDKKDYGIFPPAMDAQTAVNELCRYFLGDDWYTVTMATAQVNTEIVYEIEMKYKGKRKSGRGKHARI